MMERNCVEANEAVRFSARVASVARTFLLYRRESNGDCSIRALDHRGYSGF